MKLNGGEKNPLNELVVHEINENHTFRIIHMKVQISDFAISIFLLMQTTSQGNE